MRGKPTIGSGLLIVLAACSPASNAPQANNAEPNAAAGAASPVQSANDIPLKEFMGHVMDRNAAQLWLWTTYLSDAQGDHYTQPRTEKDWINAESDALTMVQLSYLLETPALALDDTRWAGHLARFRKAAKDSAEAAETKNFAKLEMAASDMNRACVACHVTYVPQIEGPYSEMK